MNKKLKLEVGDEFCVVDPKTKTPVNNKVYAVIKDSRSAEDFFLIVNLNKYNVVDRFWSLDDMNKFLAEAWSGFEIIKTNTPFSI